MLYQNGSLEIIRHILCPKSLPQYKYALMQLRATHTDGARNKQTQMANASEVPRRMQ